MGKAESHPEDTCQKCGGKNVNWSVENEMFNYVNGSPNGIMCPICFDKMAKEKGVDVFFHTSTITKREEVK